MASAVFPFQKIVIPDLIRDPGPSGSAISLWIPDQVRDDVVLYWDVERA
ncbi:hypothetical protein [Novosphingopyxis sp.]